jgi:ubiquinone biosynthesis protein
LVDEFSWTLRSELDYVREGRNADHIRNIFADDPRIVIPKIYWSHVTSAVLVMELLEGVSIGALEPLRERGFDLPLLAQTSAEMLLKEVFEAGFFHADPHAGNFLVLQDGRVGVLDFGMVGQLDEELRHAMPFVAMCITYLSVTTAWPPTSSA